MSFDKAMSGFQDCWRVGQSRSHKSWGLHHVGLLHLKYFPIQPRSSQRHQISTILPVVISNNVSQVNQHKDQLPIPHLTRHLANNCVTIPVLQIQRELKRDSQLHLKSHARHHAVKVHLSFLSFVRSSKYHFENDGRYRE